MGIRIRDLLTPANEGMKLHIRLTHADVRILDLYNALPSLMVRDITGF